MVQYLTDPAKLDRRSRAAPAAGRGRARRRTEHPDRGRGNPRPNPNPLAGRNDTPSAAASSGFTLIELMLALAIFGFITTIMWGSFAQTVSSKRVIQGEQERAHSVRVALMRMTREIEMAYISENENTAIAYRRTQFVGSSRADVDELMFSSFAHQRLRAGAAEGDTSLVSYYGARDPDDRRILNLMRRETRRLQAEDPDHAVRRGVRPLPGRRPGEVRLLRPPEEGVGDRLEHARRQRHASTCPPTFASR